MLYSNLATKTNTPEHKGYLMKNISVNDQLQKARIKKYIHKFQKCI